MWFCSWQVTQFTGGPSLTDMLLSGVDYNWDKSIPYGGSRAVAKGRAPPGPEWTMGQWVMGQMGHVNGWVRWVMAS